VPFQIIVIKKELSLAMQLFSPISFLVYSHLFLQTCSNEETIAVLSRSQIKIYQSSLLTLTQKEIHKNRLVFFKPSGYYCERLELLNMHR